jgi:putative SOS response-associated peptidase YedK
VSLGSVLGRHSDDESRGALTATIITSDAVETLADIHGRNPVIFPEHTWG